MPVDDTPSTASDLVHVVGSDTSGVFLPRIEGVVDGHEPMRNARRSVVGKLADILIKFDQR